MDATRFLSDTGSQFLDRDVSRRRLLHGVAAGGGVAAAIAAGARRFAPGATAQDATTPAALAGHPLVGSWLIAMTEDPSRPNTLNTFWADGNALFTIADGTISIYQGTWVATGPRTAALTLAGFHRDAGGTV